MHHIEHYHVASSIVFLVQCKIGTKKVTLSLRLVLSRFEIDTLNVGEPPIESEEDVEEVWLFWKDSGKEIRSKSIRELAQDAKEGQKEDQEVVSYYRYSYFICLSSAQDEYTTVHFIFRNFTRITSKDTVNK